MTDSPLNWRAFVDEAVRRRKAEGLSQRALAALAGVSLPTVNAFEQGDIRLRFERIVAILTALGMFEAPSAPDSLAAFIEAARTRYSGLITDLAPDHPARRPFGYFEHGYSLLDEAHTPPPAAKLRALIGDLRVGGAWEPFSPGPGSVEFGEGAIESWTGADAPDDPSVGDFWRIARDGRAFVRRGYQEDGPTSLDPGTVFDLSLPLLRAAAVLRHGTQLARAIGGSETTTLRFQGRYAGLEGRALLAWANPRLRGIADGRHHAVSPAVELTGSWPVGALEADLASAVSELLRPLYERFDGFELSREFVAEQLGGAARREGASTGPFAVTKDMVAALGDEELRTFFGKLLEAEASARNVPLAGVDLGGNQTAPDGGVDASITWSGAPDPGGWLPRRTIYFQCKAQVLAPSDIAKEMRPKDKPRPMFAALAGRDGAYVIISTDDIGHKGFEARLSAMREAVAELSNAGHLHLDFLGADRLARWANQHPGVALWLLAHSGRAMGGWQPYGAWSAPSSSGEAYLADEAARAMIDGSEGDVRTAVTALRAALATPGGAARLVGRSGMGKTRLAEAIFDDRVTGGRALPGALAVYADAGADLAVGAALVAEQLALSGVEAVLVVDNCTARTHAQLGAIVRRPGSRASLLTIDYDVGDQQLEGTLIVRLQPNSDSLLEGILAQRHPRLSRAERDHLARFSEGNARVALAIAQRSAAGIDLSTLSDDELLDRLFQTGRADDPETRIAAETASLVYAFHADASDESPVEHPVLAGLAGLSPDRFYGRVQVMLDWGIAQQRGPQRAVKPDPIANRLAARALRLNDPAALLNAFGAGPPRLFASFARRLGQLHGSSEAQTLAGRLLAPDGWLGDLAHHDSHQRRAFLKLAPAAPRATLAALERLPATELPRDDEDRRDLATLLAHLAYDPALFERAMQVLARLVLAAGPPSRDNGLGELFLERFWPLLSWTLADGDTRLELIDRLLDTDQPDVRALGVEALDHMLDAWHFSSSFDPNFGSQVRVKEWQPRGKDYTKWIEGAYSRLRAIASGSDVLGPRARAIVAEHLREHVDVGLAEVAVAAMRAVHPGRYWDKGWRQAAEALHYGTRGEVGDSERAALLALEADLRPRGLDQCFEAFVLGEPWRHFRPGGGDRHTRNASRLARAVGIRLGRSNEALSPYLERAVRAEGQTSAHAFGAGLARAVADLDALWAAGHAAFVAADNGHPGLLIGIIEGADHRDREWVDTRLDAAIADPALQRYLVHLHSGRALGADDVKRFIDALDSDALTPRDLLPLMYGGATGPIPAADLARLFAHMLDHPDGAVPVLEVLQMRFHGDKHDQRPYAPELLAVARRLLADPRSYRGNADRTDHELASIARAVFRADPAPATAVAICRALKRATRNDEDWRWRDFDALAHVLADQHLRVVLDEIVAPGEGSTRRGRHRDLASRFLGGIAGDIDDRDEAQRPRIDDRVLIEWVAEDPQLRALRLSELIPYTAALPEGGLSWSPIARELIELAHDPIPVLEAFERRFSVGVSSGPFSSRYVRRRPLVKSLIDHPDRRIRQWAREADLRLEASIEQMDRMERRHDSRFE